MVASTELVILHRSSKDTIQLTPATRVKVEHVEELITIISDDSDENSLAISSPIISPFVNCSNPESSQRFATPISHPPPYVVHPTSLSVVDCLKRIHASKGVRNVFKTLDFDTLNIQRVPL